MGYYPWMKWEKGKRKVAKKTQYTHAVVDTNFCGGGKMHGGEVSSEPAFQAAGECLLAG